MKNAGQPMSGQRRDNSVPLPSGKAEAILWNEWTGITWLNSILVKVFLIPIFIVLVLLNLGRASLDQAIKTRLKKT